MKRFLCTVLAALFFAAPLPAGQAKALSGSDYTARAKLAQRLDELFTLYPPGAYFTMDGAQHKSACHEGKCNYCQLRNIRNKNTDSRAIVMDGEKTTVSAYISALPAVTKAQNVVDYQGYTCFAFGKFAAQFLYGVTPHLDYLKTRNTKPPYERTAYVALQGNRANKIASLPEVFDKAQPGDILQTQRHTMIYLAHDNAAQTVTVYHDNYSGTHQISISAISYSVFASKYSFCSVFHYGEYDALYPLCAEGHTWGRNGVCTVCGEEYDWWVIGYAPRQYYIMRQNAEVKDKPFMETTTLRKVETGEHVLVTGYVEQGEAVMRPYYQIEGAGYLPADEMRFGWSETPVPAGSYRMNTAKKNVNVYIEPFTYAKRDAIVEKKGTELIVTAVIKNHHGQDFLKVEGKVAGYVQATDLDFVSILTPTPLPEGVTPTPTVVPSPTPTPTPQPKAKVGDAGRKNADFALRSYLEDDAAKLGYSLTKYPGNRDLSQLAACTITNCFEENGFRYITVDYRVREWVTKDARMLIYANNSEKTYTLNVKNDALISIFWPDRNEPLMFDEADEASAFYKKADWNALMACYAQITDPGETWSQPTYFLLCFDAQNRVTCIWEDVYFFANN